MTTLGLLAAVACSGGDGGTAATDPPTTETGPVFEAATTVATTTTTTTLPPMPVRIAVVAPSAVDDVSFTQSMVGSLDRLPPPIEWDIAPDTAVGDAPGELQRFADDEFDLVIAHGAELGGAVREVAAANPDDVFAWGPAAAPPDLPNVFVYDARADQGGAVLGAMAAAGSVSGVVGAVGSVQVADVERFVDGFAAGAVGAREDLDVQVTWIDSFDDAELAADAARRLADRGADALTAASQMSVGALDVAVERGARWFGNYVDQSPLAPDSVVASQVYRWEVAIAAILEALDGGESGGEPFELTLDNGGLEIVVNPSIDLDPAVRQAADEVLAEFAGRGAGG